MAPMIDIDGKKGNSIGRTAQHFSNLVLDLPFLPPKGPRTHEFRTHELSCVSMISNALSIVSN